MKWIRWQNGWWQTKDSHGEPPTEACHDPVFFSIFDCEKHDEWREIESGKWNPDTGKWEIHLKEPPKVPTLLEAVRKYLGTLEEHYREDPSTLPHLTELISAIDRELANPTKPPKYDEKLIDELLRIAREVPASLKFLMEEGQEAFHYEAGAMASRILQELQRQKTGC